MVDECSFFFQDEKAMCTGRSTLASAVSVIAKREPLLSQIPRKCTTVGINRQPGQGERKAFSIMRRTNRRMAMPIAFIS
jgi:hypothetical protein